MAKSGIMHVRSKKVERCDLSYEVDGETIRIVPAYKYFALVASLSAHLCLPDGAKGFPSQYMLT